MKGENDECLVEKYHETDTCKFIESDYGTRNWKKPAQTPK